MTMQGSTLRGSICAAAFSLAVLPAAALAQTNQQSPANQQYPASQQSTTQASGSMQSNTAGMQSSTSGANMQGASGSSGTQGSQASQGAKPPVAAVVTYVLVPVAHPSQQQMKQQGCWVSLYGKQNFTGDTLSLVGPVDMPDMVGPFGINWKDKIRSLETGPKATLRVYDNEHFRDPVSTFKPATRTADVSKRLGFFDEMSSLQISCSK